MGEKSRPHFKPGACLNSCKCINCRKGREAVKERIVEVLEKSTTVPPDMITEKSRFLEDLSMDDLDCIGFIMDIEDEFALEIPDEDLGGFKTVGDVITYLKSKLVTP